MSASDFEVLISYAVESYTCGRVLSWISLQTVLRTVTRLYFCKIGIWRPTTPSQQRRHLLGYCREHCETFYTIWIGTVGVICDRLLGGFLSEEACFWLLFAFLHRIYVFFVRYRDCHEPAYVVLTRELKQATIRCMCFGYLLSYNTVVALTMPFSVSPFLCSLSAFIPSVSKTPESKRV